VELVKTSQGSQGRRLNAQKAAQVVAGAAGLPSADALAALRAWYEGFSAREAVLRYLGNAKADGQSSRAILSAVRRQLAQAAVKRHRPDLADTFTSLGEPAKSAGASSRLSAAVSELTRCPLPMPCITDEVAVWFSARSSAALGRAGIKTLAQLTLQVPRRKMWWRGIDGLGVRGAKQVEDFFAKNPELTQRARALLPAPAQSEVVPWELIRAPQEFDGSRGMFRAPRASCVLGAVNDHAAVTAWLERHETPATQRAYRKEAERLILWAILERQKAMSSLTAEDATAYRAFLRRPSPHLRWVGPPRPRNSPEWRPFASALAPSSVAYALTVLNALFRWLVEQRYVLANPFAGLKVRGAGKGGALSAGRSFSAGEWSLVRVVADGLEWSYGWSTPAAHRLRFLLDFSYATGLRASEFVGARLGDVQQDDSGAHWLKLVGKGAKAARVALPPLARTALDRYLVQRGLPVTPAKWKPDTHLLGRVETDQQAPITTSRLWAVCKRFFRTAAKAVEESNPALASKLRAATTHWMRHTHATHSLERGVELTTVRDNLRHASIATTSAYLHGDDAKRARQVGHAFPAR
jgi:site-specific recombinase XerD